MKVLFEINGYVRSILFVISLLSFIIALPLTVSALVTEFVPGVFVSEDYTDNYHQTESDKVEEFYTNYGVDVSLGFLQKTSTLLLNYRPEFKDYEEFDDEDTWEHNASIVAEYLPSRRASIAARINYDGHGDNNESESWQHGASLAAMYQFSKYTTLQCSGDYTNSYDRQLRTDDWKESEEYGITSGIQHQFGKRDAVGVSYAYSLVDYEDPDSDDYEEHKPSVFFKYWFTPQLGFDSSMSYEYTIYDLSEEDSKSWSGDIRLSRALTKHLQIYGKYEHTHTMEDEGDHTVYTPSVGFSWAMTEDSGVSLGLGYMIHDWENEEDTEGLFIDADIFKTFQFSRRGAITISASSGFDATSDDAASLGFETYYEAGFLLSYQFLKNLSSRVTFSYVRDQFEDPKVDRVDDTIEVGTSLIWSPWRWMNLTIDYGFEDFSSDDESIEIFQEHTATIKLTLYPARPPRMVSTFSGGDRVEINRAIFNDR